MKSYKLVHTGSSVLEVPFSIDWEKILKQRAKDQKKKQDALCKEEERRRQEEQRQKRVKMYKKVALILLMIVCVILVVFLLKWGVQSLTFYASKSTNVRFNSNVPAVWVVDNDTVGTSNCLDVELSYGEHTVNVSAAGYFTDSLDIDIQKTSRDAQHYYYFRLYNDIDLLKNVKMSTNGNYYKYSESQNCIYYCSNHNDNADIEVPEYKIVAKIINDDFIVEFRTIDDQPDNLQRYLDMSEKLRSLCNTTKETYCQFEVPVSVSKPYKHATILDELRDELERCYKMILNQKQEEARMLAEKQIAMREEAERQEQLRQQQLALQREEELQRKQKEAEQREIEQRKIAERKKREEQKQRAEDRKRTSNNTASNDYNSTSSQRRSTSTTKTSTSEFRSTKEIEAQLIKEGWTKVADSPVGKYRNILEMCVVGSNISGVHTLSIAKESSVNGRTLFYEILIDNGTVSCKGAKAVTKGNITYLSISGFCMLGNVFSTKKKMDEVILNNVWVKFKP